MNIGSFVIDFSSPAVLMWGGGGLALLILGVWFLIFHISKKKTAAKLSAENKLVEKQGEKMPCLVVDAKTRLFGVEQIELTKLTEVKEKSGLGRQWDYLGQQVFYLLRDKEGEYSPITPPQTFDNPPTLLYNALQQDAEAIVFDVTKEGKGMEGFGWYALLAGLALAAMMFTTNAAAKGG